ncbi:MAG: biopolymer transporter ExbD [Saprospiraceae bacterium]
MLHCPVTLNLKLRPLVGQKSKPTLKTPNVTVNKDGRFYLDGKRITAFDLEDALAKKAKSSGDKLSITISPEQNTPIKHVAFIMNIAMKYGIDAILAAEE